jgi:hypothetical protein
MDGFDSVSYPGMPRWLLQILPVLAVAWDQDRGAEFRLNDALGRGVPFRVVHDWQATAVAPLAIETSSRCGGDPALHRRVQTLHQRALSGAAPALTEWLAALRPALREICDHAYPTQAVYDRAHAGALAHGLAPANASMVARYFGTAEDYARAYAELSSGANATAFADANAQANAEAGAAAFAAGDAESYADAHAYGVVNACIAAHAHGEPDPVAAHLAACRRLAAGLADSLIRAAP